MHRLGLLFLTLCSALACGEPAPASTTHLAELNVALADYGVQVEVAVPQVAALHYQTPDPACALVYQLKVHYTPEIKDEKASTSHLALGHAPQSKIEAPTHGIPIPKGEFFSGRVVYQGIRVEKQPITRDVFLSAEHAGPASPTAGCLPQTWDPIEDALALGWPKLPARTTAVGERWRGIRVGGKCNRSACVDPTNGRGGAENHHRSCVTQDWENTLLGLYEHEGHALALVYGTWTDGHGKAEASNTLGIWSERTTLISLEHGRPVWSKFKLHHNFPRPTVDEGWRAVERDWEMASIDSCAGSLASLGWERPAEVLEPNTFFTESLANSEELRRRHTRVSAEPTGEATPAAE